MRLKSGYVGAMCVFTLLLSTAAILAQQPKPSSGQSPATLDPKSNPLAQQPVIHGLDGTVSSTPPPSGSSNRVLPVRLLPDYVLGPSDEFVIRAADIPEIADKPIRIGAGGDINLALVGRIQAAGMTIQQLETELTERLKRYVKSPQVAVSMQTFRSQAASVTGAVDRPGLIQLDGRKTLLEVLLLAGGLKPDASYKVTIQRQKEWGPIPLPSKVKIDPDAPYSVAEVNVRSIMDASDTAGQNIQILPDDIITVLHAKLVYAFGELKMPGGFALDDTETISVLQLLARAQGTSQTASKKDAKIIRPVPGSERIQIAINLGDLLNGKIKDPMLLPEDILYVPDSYAKGTLRRTMDTIIQATTGLAIYH